MPGRKSGEGEGANQEKRDGTVRQAEGTAQAKAQREKELRQGQRGSVSSGSKPPARAPIPITFICRAISFFWCKMYSRIASRSYR